MSKNARRFKKEKLDTQPTKKEKTILQAKSNSQIEFIKAIHSSDIVIANGVAGCGKTICSIGVALGLLDKGKVKRIVITRPAVEAGEKLGYLPGNPHEKLKPYLEPMYYSLKQFISYYEIKQLENSGALSIVPIGFMRGLTFDDAIVIIDEAQNCSLQQLLLVLTRIGHNSKMIISGDLSQCDISKSGLRILMKKLKNVDSRITVMEFAEDEIIRNPIIQVLLEKLLCQSPAE